MAAMSPTLAARMLSVVGHPGLLMPAAVAWGATHANMPAPLLHAAVASAVLVTLIVGAYSLWQVRSGSWSHVDASQPQERRQLNRFLAVLLFAAAAVLAWWAPEPSFAVGPALACAVVVIAHLLRRWLKVSLHAAFALFAATLVWPSPAATALMVALVAGVAWSRLVLRRHTPAEVALGLLLGAGAGVGLRLFAG
jgi:phosphotransferase system  glucose/maltose/N-acetylglucosamine-specific IIC component